MRRIAATVAVAAGLLVGPASAQALNVSVGSAAPADTSAGANSDFTLNLGFTEGSPKDLAIALPPGLLGDPTGVPQCAQASFLAGRCDPGTAVGSALAGVTALGLPAQAPGTVFNLQPTGTEPARLGIALKPTFNGLPVGTINSESPISVRADGGLTSTVTGLPAKQYGLDVTINSLSLTLKGKTATGAFMRNPTSCAPATTNVAVTGQDGSTASGSAAFTPTACDKQAFEPALTAALTGPRAGLNNGKPGLSTNITQPKGQAGVKSVTVQLPKGVGAQLSAASRACEQAAFAANTCPATSVVGSASASVAVLTQPLTGPVSLIRTADLLPSVDVVLNGPVSQRLSGTTSLVDGRITTKFDNVPDFPLTAFQLAFNAGDTGLLQNTGNPCRTGATLDATIVSQSGATKTLQTQASIEGCPASTTPEPDAAAKPRARGSVTLGRTADGTPTLKLRVRATGAKLRRVTATLPKGLSVDRGDVSARKPKGSKLRAAGRTLRLTLKKSGARSATVTLRRGVRAAERLRSSRRTVSFGVRVAFTGGTSARTTIKTRTRP